MRCYLPISIDDLNSFHKSETLKVERAFAGTIKYLMNNSELDEEEVEYQLSLLAAQIALKNSPSIILAIEISLDQIGEHLEDSVELIKPVRWGSVQCAFECSEADDELIWFATQEIEDQLKIWSGQR